MTRPSWLAAAALATFLALAQNNSTQAQSISFASGQPVGGTGQITANGTYSLGSGQTLSSISLYCAPTLGGTQSSNSCSTSSGSWSGVVAGLPGGLYNCWAVMTYNTGKGGQSTTQTAIVQVNVGFPN